MNIDEIVNSEEYLKCKNDFRYFILKYIKVSSIDGVNNIYSHEYVLDYLKHIHSNKISVTLKARQMGFTTITLAYILWYSIFNEYSTSIVTSHNVNCSYEHISRINEMIVNISRDPLMSHIIKHTFQYPQLYKSKVVLLNGSKILSGNTRPSTVGGFNPNITYLDETAFIDGRLLKQFNECVFPTIMSSKSSKLIMTSSVNPSNEFFNYICDQASKEGYLKKYSWECNPLRDDIWKAKTIECIGESAFNIEFGLNT